MHSGGGGAHTAEVNQIAKLTLTAETLTNSKTTRRRAMVVGELKSLYDGSVVKCEVDQSGPGKYHIRYTPTVRGRHELAISIDDQQIANSPFSVSVSISPTLLGKPVRVWTGVQRPTGITANSMGEILVCTYGGVLMKLEDNGEHTVLVRDSSYQWRDLATDAEDNIICVSYSADILLYEKLTNTYRIRQVDPVVSGPGRYGVAVAGGDVLVTEFGNQGTFIVYNRNLEYVRQVKHDGAGVFVGLTLDQRNILYISDFKSIQADSKSTIRVFSLEGDFLRCLDGGKELGNPNGVCVSGSYLYFTDYGHDHVMVFTTCGSYVTSLSQTGTNEGEFQKPIAICINKDNFVFVCEFSGDRIQCF